MADDFGLNWHYYGFRMYDPAIGRFPSVDPIADQFAHVSPFNYAENEPVGHIDLWGLQQVEFSFKGLINDESEGSPDSKELSVWFKLDMGHRNEMFGGFTYGELGFTFHRINNLGENEESGEMEENTDFQVTSILKESKEFQSKVLDTFKKGRELGLNTNKLGQVAGHIALQEAADYFMNGGGNIDNGSGFLANGLDILSYLAYAKVLGSRFKYSSGAPGTGERREGDEYRLYFRKRLWEASVFTKDVFTIPLNRGGSKTLIGNAMFIYSHDVED